MEYATLEAGLDFNATVVRPGVVRAGDLVTKLPAEPSSGA